MPTQSVTTLRTLTSPILNFKDFVKKYGDKTTSNIQLTEWAKELDIPNFHCIMRDEVKHLSMPNNGKPLNIIVNLEKSDQPGSDWNACYTRSNPISNAISFYFSSYALPPLKEVKTFLNRNGVKNRKYSTTKLQDWQDEYCGQIALFVLYRLNTGKATEENFENIVLELHLQLHH